MKKLLTLILILSTYQGFSQVSVGMSYTSNGFGMSLSALSDEGGVEGTLGYSTPLVSNIKPTFVYGTIGKQFLLTQNDGNNYSVTPSVGYANQTKKVIDPDSKQGDLMKVSDFKPFYGLELGKDSYMGRISLTANYSGTLFYGVKMRIFFSRKYSD